jgi:predicted DNA-binding transcriptional regulator AlpA
MENMRSDLMRGDEVDAFFGRISRVTRWRYVKTGRIPAPIMLSKRAARWVRSECEAAREKMIKERDGDQ